MATLTITVDDAVVPRVRAAYGAETNAQLKTLIIRSIKDVVSTYEHKLAEVAAQVAVDEARAARDAAIVAANVSAQAISVS